MRIELPLFTQPPKDLDFPKHHTLLDDSAKSSAAMNRPVSTDQSLVKITPRQFGIAGLKFRLQSINLLTSSLSLLWNVVLPIESSLSGEPLAVDAVPRLSALALASMIMFAIAVGRPYFHPFSLTFILIDAVFLLFASILIGFSMIQLYRESKL